MRSIKISSFLFSACLLLATTGALQSQPGLSGDHAEFDALLSQLEKTYSSLETVHLKATALITLVPGADTTAEPVVGSGTYEYWAKGDRFRIRVQTDLRLQLAPDRDLAWDGESFYDLAISDGFLRRGTVDLEELPIMTAIPNPLFLPLDFLMEGDDPAACRVCELRFSEVTSREFWSSRRERFARESVAVEHHGEASVLQSGRYVEAEYVKRQIFIVAVTDDDGKVVRVRSNRVDRVLKDGRPVLEIDLKEFGYFRGPGVLAELPQHLQVRAYEPAESGPIGEPTAHLDLVINQLTLNAPILDSTFRIDGESAQAVWDEDTSMFEVAPGGDQ